MKPIAKLLLLCMGVMLFGCGIKPRSSEAVSYFLLDVKRPPNRSRMETAVCLQIRPCRMAAAFADRSLVYRTGDVAYEQDYYHLFLTDPGSQVTDILQNWLRQAGFEGCAAGDRRTESYTLEPRISAFYADFSDPLSPLAVVEMQVSVTKLEKEGLAQSVVLDKTVTVKTPLPSQPTAAEVVKALSHSLSNSLLELEEDLRRIR